MRSIILRGHPVDSARSDIVERQLRRYCPRFQGPVRRLATCHSRVADLAVSFPALLLALAVPRSGLDPARAIARAIEGAALADVAAKAGVPLWLRRLPPEAFSRPITKLPSGTDFSRQIANHLPRSPKLASVWLQAVISIADVAHDSAAVWIAREIARERRVVSLDRLRLVGLWAWFSGQSDTLGRRLIARPWTPEMRIGSALSAADQWRNSICLHTALGRESIADPWLQPARVAGYDFTPLRSAREIDEEATAMKNCLRSYGYDLAHNRVRLWSMRKDGQRVATLSVAVRFRDPLPNVVELRRAGNAEASREVWWAARQWLHMHDLTQIETGRRDRNSMPLDRATWISLWRPYWLAKRCMPEWLPLAPSTAVLRALGET
jgi:hypothetical protein